MTRENSIAVPCCHQAFYVTCLARSFSSCGLQCPFCNQSLAEFSRYSSFSASSLFHGCMIDVNRSPTNRGLNSMVLLAGFPPRPETPVFFCCRRIGPPPQFEPSNDHRMEWSPSPVAHSEEWAAGWLCVGCSRTVDLSDAPLRFTAMSPVFECAHDGGGCSRFAALVLVFAPRVHCAAWDASMVGEIPLSQHQGAGLSHGFSAP